MEKIRRILILFFAAAGLYLIVNKPHEQSTGAAIICALVVLILSFMESD